MEVKGQGLTSPELSITKPTSTYSMTLSAQWTQLWLDTYLKSEPHYSRGLPVYSIDAHFQPRCIGNILKHKLVVLATNQLQFAHKASKLLAIKEVSIIMYTSVQSSYANSSSPHSRPPSRHFYIPSANMP